MHGFAGLPCVRYAVTASGRVPPSIANRPWWKNFDSDIMYDGRQQEVQIKRIGLP
ncbi:hypothetical protein PHLCEN_2v10914 [Hermanssonia centrifuga]|uniref:Uncharacterized protein n=1 Tax=Hermanssonia centrifuga TaxID=98765 RepID=A0A2R6NME2_9APHY|nr:hypothetical protein PHLCEN_2v10914 [Hermanssonia centrifuga]